MDNNSISDTKRRSLFLATGIMTIAAVSAMLFFAPLAYAQKTAPPPAYTNILDSSVVFDSRTTVKYEVIAEGVIPKKVDTFINSKLLFGYAWIGDPNLYEAVVVTMGTIGNHDAKKVWNAQTITLAKPNGAPCVVDIGDPNAIVSVNENILNTVLDRTDATILPSEFAGATAFELQQDRTACPASTSPSGLKMVAIGDPDL